MSGMIVVQYGEGVTKTLGPGSDSQIPANTNHAGQCGNESDCLLLLSSTGPFAILPGAD